MGELSAARQVLEDDPPTPGNNVALRLSRDLNGDPQRHGNLFAPDLIGDRPADFSDFEKQRLLKNLRSATGGPSGMTDSLSCGSSAVLRPHIGGMTMRCHARGRLRRGRGAGRPIDASSGCPRPAQSFGCSQRPVAHHRASIGFPRRSARVVQSLPRG